MLVIVVRLIALLFVLVGTIFVYDARILSNIWFGFGDQNEATSGLKILGFIITIIGAFIIYKMM